MVEEDRYCVDILLQVSAARAALDGLGKLLLRAHVESCIADAVAADRPRVRREKVDELQALLSRLAHIGGR